MFLTIIIHILIEKHSLMPDLKDEVIIRLAKLSLAHHKEWHAEFIRAAEVTLKEDFINAYEDIKKMKRLYLKVISEQF